MTRTTEIKTYSSPEEKRKYQRLAREEQEESLRKAGEETYAMVDRTIPNGLGL